MQEKRAERGIVVSQLINVGSFAWAECSFGGGGLLVIVMGVSNVGEDDGNAFFQHGLDHRQRLRGGWVEVQLIESGERNTVIINDAASGAACKRRVDVLQTEQR